MRKYILGLVVFLAFFGMLSGQVLENYDYNHEILRKNSWMGSESQIEIPIDLSTYPLAKLVLKVPAECTLFLDGKLWFIASKDTVLSPTLANLSEQFGNKVVILTLIGGDLSGDKVSVKKVLENIQPKQSEDLIEAENIPVPRQGHINHFTDFFFVSLVVILFFLAIYKLAYPYLLAVMLQPLSVINAEDFSDSGSLQKFFSFDIQLYLFIVSMMLSQAILTGGIIFKPEQVSQWITLDFTNLIFVWIGFTFFILVLTILKFIAIRVFSYLFDLGKTDFAHFFYLLRMIVFSVFLVSIATAFLMINDFKSLESNYILFVSGLFWVYLLGIVGLFLIMMSRLSFKKYHLFTYLCIAELVPFLILSKWIWVLVQ